MFYVAHIILTRRHLAESPAWALAKPLKKELETLGHKVELLDLYDYKPPGKPKFDLKKIIAEEPGVKRGRGMQVEYLGDGHVGWLQKNNQQAIVVELHNAGIHRPEEKPVQKFRFAKEPVETRGRKVLNFEYAICRWERAFLAIELPAIVYYDSKAGRKPTRIYPHRLKIEEWEAKQKQEETQPFSGWHYDVGESRKFGYLSPNVAKKIALGITRLIKQGKISATSA
ncbi:MAG: hypothetical protein V1817_05050 [Candidatus Micrarchaeota archaeon]